MRVEWTVLAVSVALAGCAPQVVYVPQPSSPPSETEARKARNEECLKAMVEADASGKIMLSAAKRCKRNPTRFSSGCVEMRGVMKVINDREILGKSTSCLNEMNAGGYGVDQLTAHLQRQAEIVKTIRSLPLAVLD